MPTFTQPTRAAWLGLCSLLLLPSSEGQAVQWVAAQRGVLSGSAVRGACALRGWVRMPSLETQAKRGEGLAFRGLLSTHVYWASGVDQPLPRPWRYSSADLPALEEHVHKDRPWDGSSSTTAPIKPQSFRDFLLKRLFIEPPSRLARNKLEHTFWSEPDPHGTRNSGSSPSPCTLQSSHVTQHQATAVLTSSISDSLVRVARGL